MTNDVYFNDEENRVTKMESRDFSVDEIVAQDGFSHLEMLDDESAYLGVEIDGEMRKFLVYVSDDGDLEVRPYENKHE